MNEIKDRIRNYKYLKARKRELEIRLQELIYKISPGELSYGYKGGETNKISTTVANEAIKLADIEEKLKNFIDEYGLELARIENALDMLSEKERQAIKLRFIEDYEMATVCYKLDRGITTVKRYLKNGLNKMQKLLSDQK